ncbi:MAG: hypothetical protein OXI74_13875 [Rhodospirillaceae bacterium]|nr:hypothetical protein [Rhodospirillaceae bacterium]
MCQDGIRKRAHASHGEGAIAIDGDPLTAFGCAKSCLTRAQERVTAIAVRTIAAKGIGKRNDPLTRLQACDVLTDCLDYAGRLVTDYGWNGYRKFALLHGQIGVAHARLFYPHPNFMGGDGAEFDIENLQRLAGRGQNRTFHRLRPPPAF